MKYKKIINIHYIHKIYMMSFPSHDLSLVPYSPSLSLAIREDPRIMSSWPPVLTTCTNTRE